MIDELKDFKDKLNLTVEDYNKYYALTNEEQNQVKLNMITIDVKRTLTEEFIGKNPTFYTNLIEVLKTFVISSDNQIYISGMSFIAKMILKLTNNDKIKAFIVLKNLFEDKNIKELYENMTENIYNKFNVQFKEKMNVLFQHFQKNQIEIHFINCWLKTLFCYNFDDNIGEYVFKLYIKNSDFDVYIKAALAILMNLESELLKKNTMEIFITLNSNKIKIDSEKVIENINKLN